MAEYETTMHPPTSITTYHEAFGVCDKYGREIGAKITLYEAELVEVDRSKKFYTFSRLAPGRYFVFEPQATRNGERYGASQRDHFFTTAEARDAAIAKYLKAARKRAQH